MTDLSLAEKVEGLTCPCRNTDIRIHLDVLMADVPEYRDIWRRWTAEQRDEICPHYTASLDAVVALIEKELPGWGWSVTSRRPGVSYACVTEPEAVVETVRGEASSHALALLAAFLRAKGEQSG